MKKFVLALFSLWLIWTQSPLALRPEIAAAGEAVCKCCCDCGGACGCMAPASPNSKPLPLPATSLSVRTELPLMAVPADSLALPVGKPAENLFSSPSPLGDSGVPIYRRDCALLL